MATSSPSSTADWTSSLEKYEKGFEGIFVGDPQTTKSDLENLFTPTFTSTVDGKTLDFTEFVQHIQHLRTITTTVKVKVTQFLRDGNQLAERHLVTVDFSNKPQSAYEVFLFSTVHESGRIDSIVETLRHTHGLEEDRGLGSARA
ncbi:hypothetical protein FSARC_13467 [Fusarium sarcochroum]|uniref:SnoaL-like domain-containing protein n=1 Tax=Fusarium sarcochroum TaxID=1208366 RepID=A0A8H4T172_9HYPO|nr:hypothetical protein FSARC_13467 [Fusarium sarcochroum]